MYIGGSKAAVATLPVTGAAAYFGIQTNLVVSIAVAVAVGLVTWGAVYSHQAN